MTDRTNYLSYPFVYALHACEDTSHNYSDHKGLSHNLGNLIIITSGDENHLCRASLHENHKVSLKAQKHGAGTPNYNSMSVTELHE